MPLVFSPFKELLLVSTPLILFVSTFFSKLFRSKSLVQLAARFLQTSYIKYQVHYHLHQNNWNKLYIQFKLFILSVKHSYAHYTFPIHALYLIKFILKNSWWFLLSGFELYLGIKLLHSLVQYLFSMSFNYGHSTSVVST